MKKMKLNIQLFAEDGANVEVNETSMGANEQAEAVETKQPTFTELLQNPEYQREFDKLVNKSLNTAKTNWEKEIRSQIEQERTEAEKLAKMDAEQKAKYEYNKIKSENEKLHGIINANDLYRTANKIANEKGIPSAYLGLLDFTKETADTITEKISQLEQIRQRDLQMYLNSKLRQPTPTEKRTQPKKIDPYIEGFLSEL